MAVQAVRIDGRVGAERDLHAGGDGFALIVFDDGADIEHLLLEHGGQVAVLAHPIDQIERGHQPSAVGFHGGDIVGIDVGAVLDGIDAGIGGEEDALRAVGVGGYFAAEAVGIGDQGLELVEAVLAGLRIVALGKHAAGGADLDEIGAVLDILAHLLLHGGDAVGDAFRGGMELEGKEVVVAMAAGDAQRRSANLHVRAGDIAVVDVIAEGDIGVSGCADIADAGEAGFEGDLGEAHTVESLAHGIGGEAGVGVEIVAEGEVGVDVDQAGQDGHGAQVDFAVAGRGGGGGSRRDGGDAITGDDDGLIGGFLSAADVEDVAGADEDARLLSKSGCGKGKGQGERSGKWHFGSIAPGNRLPRDTGILALRLLSIAARLNPGSPSCSWGSLPHSGRLWAGLARPHRTTAPAWRRTDRRRWWVSGLPRVLASSDRRPAPADGKFP